MKFSIIIPAHNEEKTIEAALLSVVQQSFTNYELIVVCDSCTDRTKEIAQKFTNKILDVDYHRSGKSRNAGLDIAQGDWILFLDADDWYLHEFVLQQLSEKLGDEDVLMFTLIWKGVGYGSVRSSKGTIYPHVANKCWRRSFIGDTRFGEFEIAEDEEFFKALMSKNPKIVEWDMPLYYYNYLRQGSKSEKLGRSVDSVKVYWGSH